MAEFLFVNLKFKGVEMVKRLFLSIGLFMASVVAYVSGMVVMVVGLGADPVNEFKNYVGVFERTLSAFALMMYSASVSGAVFIGNKLFGSKASTSNTELFEYQRLQM